MSQALAGLGAVIVLGLVVAQVFAFLAVQAASTGVRFQDSTLSSHRGSIMTANSQRLAAQAPRVG